MTFNSVYEITNNLTTIAGQHIIEYFTGSSLDSKRWGVRQAGSSSTFGMDDSVNGGYKLTNVAHNVGGTDLIKGNYIGPSAGLASGSAAGPGSYVSVDAGGKLVLTESAGGGGGSFNGSTANGVVTYGGATQADVEANMTFDGNT